MEREREREREKKKGGMSKNKRKKKFWSFWKKQKKRLKESVYK